MFNIIFAATYGCGTYGQGAYSSTGACGATTTGTGLVNTGTAVIFVLTLACLLIFATLLVRFYKRK